MSKAMCECKAVGLQAVTWGLCSWKKGVWEGDVYRADAIYSQLCCR